MELLKMDPAPFPYRLAASDLDGTLLGPRKEISAGNQAAVRRLREAGARFILASGRRHQNSVRFQRQLGLDGPLISCAGALVKDPQTDETLHEVPIPPAVANQLIADGESRGCTVIYYHRDHLYVSERNHWTELYESRVGEKAELYPGSLLGLGGAGALKIVWYREAEEIRRLRPAVEAGLAADYRGQLSMVSTDAENLEFVAVDANKANAVAVVAKYYGVEPSQTVTFGDGENDAPMLRWAGLGVAMDGGSRWAKESAGLVSPDGPPEESFGRAVDRIFENLGDACQVRRPNFRSNSA